MPRHHNNNEITRGLILTHRSVDLFLFNICTSSYNQNLVQHLLTALVSFTSKCLEKLTCRQLQKQTNGCHLKSTTCEFDGNRSTLVISWNQNKTEKCTNTKQPTMFEYCTCAFIYLKLTKLAWIRKGEWCWRIDQGVTYCYWVYIGTRLKF